MALLEVKNLTKAFGGLLAVNNVSFNVEEGEIVKVESEVGKVVLPVKISEIIENNLALIPRNFPATGVNKLQMRKRRSDRVKISKMDTE